VEHRKDHLPRRKRFLGRAEHVQCVAEQGAAFEPTIPLVALLGRHGEGAHSMEMPFWREGPWNFLSS
jgi:hypothetical protein